MDTFEEAPTSIAEARAAKTRDGAQWTPRDLLVKLLRDIDSGECVIDQMIVSYSSAGQSGYWNATPDLTTALGLLAQAQMSMFRDSENQHG